MSEPVDRDAWLAERRTGIGGSDAAAALGLSPWRTPLALYLEKLGEAQPFVDNEAMLWGRVLEPAIRDEYQRRTGRVVARSPRAIVNPQHAFMRANLDGMTCEPVPRVVEIKTARMDKGWGEAGSDEVPQQYFLQCVHYMICTGAQLADLAVLIGGQDFRIYTIRNNPTLTELVVEGEREFWTHVQDRAPPPATTLPEINMRWRDSRPAQVEFSAEVAEALNRLATLRAEISDREAECEAYEATVKAALEDRDTGTIDGVVACTWKRARGSQVFDAKRFESENPDVYAKYLTTRQGSRRFLLKV
jgi:putative phage-type endonuclease